VIGPFEARQAKGPLKAIEAKSPGGATVLLRNQSKVTQVLQGPLGPVLLATAKRGAKHKALPSVV